MYTKYNSDRKAAASLGWPQSTFNVRKNKAIELGLTPDPEFNIPQGHDLKGTSRLYDSDGNVKMQWIKTDRNFDKQKELLLIAAEELKEDIVRERPVRFIPHINEELLSCYVLTDYHFGQLSWGEETGEDWDIDIARETLVKYFGAAIKSAPNSKTAILAQMGDFLHWDGLDAVTPTSGHVLDADTRYGKVVRMAIQVLRDVVQILLEKHNNVHIIMAEGNHDLASSVWLRELYSVLYENEPRVTVDTSQTPYYAFEWGNTSLFFHHGHKQRINQISKAFVGQFREIFGRTEKSYAHIGHYHHKEVKEDQMMIVEQHPTLAARDAYSARGAYQSQRGASVITYSKSFGEVSRVTIRPEMLK